MEKFVYTNPKGGTITIDYGNTYIIEKYDGLAASEIIPVTARGFRQNGNTLSYVSLGIRIITLSFYIASADMNTFYTNRKFVSSVFNPLLGEGILEYTNNHLVKQIKVLPSRLPRISEKFGPLQLVTVEFTAYDPFWYDKTETISTMTDYVGGITLNNVGDYETPMRVEFSGITVNPQILNETTGELIKVNKSLTTGEKLIIDTRYGNKTVTHITNSSVRTSAYNLITNDSKFFSLQLGNNQIKYSADMGTPVIKIYWKNRFVGV